MSATSSDVCPAIVSGAGILRPQLVERGGGEGATARLVAGALDQDDVTQTVRSATARLRSTGEPGRVPSGHDLVEHPGVVDPTEAGVGDENRAVRLGEHVAQLVGLVEKVERDGDRARSSDGELQHHELGVVGHEQADPVPRTDSERSETISEPPRLIGDLGVGERSLIGDHQRALRVVHRATVEPAVERDGHPRIETVVKSSTPLGDGRHGISSNLFNRN